ncbi:4Fe-4S dicluster domain-containing protein [Enteroscipio rubneri]|uniref:4Fe-4S ferredoxin n=1 Tax=Enteroscipio rubneri TaxID=2070686 RepID=A0A2K2UET0_9ACTN|nr:4Fe-4S dicluster domain-containing protein [Enteroscipio rubneri]PNV68752.1 4Fe-4S ferredoxin [Enteroscipio rubneri]
MTRYGFVIDTTRCVGCNFCSMACKVENNLPEDVWWSRAYTDGGEVEQTPSGEWPDNLHMAFMTVGCQHCDNPACVKACPVGATYKDADTGIVRQDFDKCIGCRMCMAACPYSGVRTFNWEEPKYFLDFPVGSADAPKHQKGVVEKCTMCWHRIAKGERPACADVCRTLARHWGDFDDPDSEVSKLIRDRPYKQLLADEGTGPCVYYLV